MSLRQNPNHPHGQRSLKTLAWEVPLRRECKLTLCYLASLADKLTGQTFPAKATLMERTGLTEEELRVALADLKSQRLVTWERREEASNVYTVHRDELERLAKDAKRSGSVA